jgi:hypothetical protein
MEIPKAESVLGGIYDKEYQRVGVMITKALENYDGQVLEGHEDTGFIVAASFDPIPVKVRDKVEADLVRDFKENGWDIEFTDDPDDDEKRLCGVK